MSHRDVGAALDPAACWVSGWGRWQRRLGALTAGVVTLFGCGTAAAASGPRPAAPSYLFSVPSAAGSLQGTSNQHLTLHLTAARDYLTRFTDRPLRQASVVANVDFARRFKRYFATAAPNAVLTYTPNGAHIPVSIVFTIGQPRWSARRSTWTFPATRIRKQTDNLPGTSVDIKPPRVANPRHFGHATLLIDGSDYCVLRPAAQCPGADLQHRNIPGINLMDADLSRANLVGATLSGANLAYANLAYAGLNGDSLSNANLFRANVSYADLSGTDLRGATLGLVDFSYANLERANLSNDNLQGEDFVSTNLAGTNLSNVTLQDARLIGASLVGANLEHADLSDANLTFANLANADLLGANLTGANLNALLCNTRMPDGSTNNTGC
jgi:uncharacterized protein YjbI with pentapeptide repeats